MHKYLVYSAFGWLTLSGILHFAIDVVSQHLRGKRALCVETTLYYGLNSVFALGQVAFGALALIVVSRAMHIFDAAPALIWSLVVGVGWLAAALLFMSYWEPKANAAIYCALIAAALVVRG